MHKNTPPQPIKVGIIGLGNMGMPVARRLAQDPAFHVTGYDTSQATMARFLADTPTAQTTGEMADLVTDQDIVITCLPSAKAVHAVYLGKDGLCTLLKPGQTTLDLSTLAPKDAVVIADAVIAQGARHIEAPVIGGVADGENGTLYLLVASHGVAQLDDFPAPPLQTLRRIGSEVTVTGPPGSASLIKVVQNGLGLVQLVAIAEALGVCRAAGLDPARFAAIVGSAPGMANSPLFRRVTPAMVDPALEEHSARLAIAGKDVGLFSAVAGGVGADAPLADIAAGLFAEAESAGMADADFTRIADLFKTTPQEH